MVTTTRKRGYALISAYLVVIVLLTLLAAFVLYSFTESRTARRYQMTTTALYLAEAGIDEAIVALRALCYEHSPCCYITFNYLINKPIGTIVINRNFTLLSDCIGGYGFDITVVDKLPNINDPQEVICRIHSTGHTPANWPNNPNYQKKDIEAFVKVTGHLFPAALLMKSDIDLNNSTIDSYDSSKGPYDPNNHLSNGDIISNNRNNKVDVIVLSGGTTVYGDATVGSYTPVGEAIEIKGKAEITGDQINLRAEKGVWLDPVTIPTGLTQLDLSKVDKGVQTYPGGTYVTPSIKIDGQGSVNFQGPTTIYVTGNVDIGGNGIFTANNLPENLIINVEGDQKINIHGNANFYGALYAPDSKDIKVMGNEGAEVFGSIVGYSAKINGKIHYDEALSKIAGNYMNVELIAWQDLH